MPILKKWLIPCQNPKSMVPKTEEEEEEGFHLHKFSFSLLPFLLLLAGNISFFWQIACGKRFFFVFGFFKLKSLSCLFWQSGGGEI